MGITIKDLIDWANGQDPLGEVAIEDIDLIVYCGIRAGARLEVGGIPQEEELLCPQCDGYLNSSPEDEDAAECRLCGLTWSRDDLKESK